MGDIGTSSLLLAISILPGYFFCIFLSRINFSSGRGAPTRISFLFPSIFFSLLMILVSDIPTFKNLFINLLLPLLRDFEIYNDLSKIASQSTLALVASALTKSSDTSNLGAFISICLFYLAPFSLIFTVSVSFAFRLAEEILSANPATILLFTFIVFEHLVRIPMNFVNKILQIILGDNYKKIRIWYEKIVTVFLDFIPTWIYLPFLVIIVFLILLVAALLVLMLVPVAVIAAIAQLTVSMIFSVFRHPSEKLFQSLANKNQTCIVEALDSNDTLYKGRYVSFEPKSADEIDSITLDHLIQYKKSDSQKFFTREGGRKINKFHNHNSRLTLILKDIKNFNVWFLNYDSFSIDLQVTNQDSLKNYFWYLDLIVRENGYIFSLDKLKPKINVSLITDFFTELDSTLKQRYRSSFWTYKKLSLRREYLTLLRANLKIQRNAAKNFHPKHQATLRTKRKDLLSLLRTEKF
jgi:hypothetical protein